MYSVTVMSPESFWAVLMKYYELNGLQKIRILTVLEVRKIWFTDGHCPPYGVEGKRVFFGVLYKSGSQVLTPLCQD